MNHVVVDQERCLHDGFCVSVCPVSVLELETTLVGAVPTSSQGNRCIRYGHCVSVCRAGALALTFLPRSDLRPMNTAHTISPEQAEQLLQARRSIRRYRDKLVPREIIARALDSARFAPSGVNRQPVAWTVVSGLDAVHRLAAGVLEWARTLVQQKVGQTLLQMAGQDFGLGKAGSAAERAQSRADLADWLARKDQHLHWRPDLQRFEQQGRSPRPRGLHRTLAYTSIARHRLRCRAPKEGNSTWSSLDFGFHCSRSPFWWRLLRLPATTPKNARRGALV